MIRILEVFSNYLKIFFRYILIPLLVSVYFLRLNYPEKEMFKIIYILSISSLVGYWTNYLAIKMLFKPKEKTFFGLQGVIPANRFEIAKALGKVIREKFFGPDDIIEYIEEKELIKKFFNRTKIVIEEKLNDKKAKKRIVKWINEKFNIYSPRIYNFLRNFSEYLMKHYFSKSFSPEKVAKIMTDFVETNIKNGNIDSDRIIDALVPFIKRNIPQIAHYLNRLIEKEIEQYSFIQKAILKTGKYCFQLNSTTIKNLLRKAVNDPEFRQEVYKIVGKVALDLSQYLKEERVNKEIQKHFKTFQDIMITSTKDRLLPYVLKKINDFLSKDTSWNKIEVILDSIINIATKELEKLISSNEFTVFVKKLIPDLLDKFDVESLIAEKARQFETDQLEEVIVKVTGEHLSHIEILGGILGGIVGIAVFDLKLFAFVLSGIALIMLFDSLITWVMRKKMVKVKS